MHSKQQWRSIPLAPQPWQHGVSLEFFILAILICTRWPILMKWLRVILICILMISNDVQHFLKYSSAIRDSSVENSLFRIAPRFLIGLFDLLMSSFTICSCTIVYISVPPKFYSIMTFGHQRNLQRDVILQMEKCPFLLFIRALELIAEVHKGKY